MPTITVKAMGAKPDIKDTWIVESLGRGCGAFVGRITPAGERTFYFRYTGPGRAQVRLRIDKFDPDGINGLKVAEAREVAVKWSDLYRGDPKRDIAPVLDLRGHLAQQEQDRLDAEADRRRADEEARRLAELEASRRLTVRQVFERWAGVDLKPHTGADGRRRGRKDGGDYTRQQFERHVFPTVGDTFIAELSRADLMAILDTQKAAGKLRTANVLLADLKQMLRFATLRDIVDRNVLDGVKKSAIGGADPEGDRTLIDKETGDDSELCQLVQQLPKAKMAPRSEIAVRLILASACRVGELMGAEWRHVDLKGQTWYIPADESKNERDHTIHLSAFALEQFKALHALREAGDDGQLLPWVFPDRAGRGPVCVKSFGKQLADRQREPDKRLKRRSKNTHALTLPGGRWTAHDLRRTAATIMGELGFSENVIDACLNHIIKSRVTRTYVRTRRRGEQAMAFDALGQYLDERFTGSTAPDNVVTMPRAA